MLGGIGGRRRRGSGKYSGLWDTTCVRHVCACVFTQCLCRSPASEGAFAAPGAPSSSFIPQEASSLGRMGPGLWGLTLPGLGPWGLQSGCRLSGEGSL